MTDFHKLPNHGLPKETLDRFNEIVKETGDKKMVMVPRIFELEQKIKEYDQLFSLQFAADGRATKMWQEANPGNDMVWPDSAKLSVWLMDQLFGLRSSLLGLKYLCAGEHGGYTETTKRKIEYEIEQVCNEFAPKPSVNGTSEQEQES